MRVRRAVKGSQDTVPPAPSLASWSEGLAGSGKGGVELAEWLGKPVEWLVKLVEKSAK